MTTPRDPTSGVCNPHPTANYTYDANFPQPQSHPSAAPAQFMQNFNAIVELLSINHNPFGDPQFGRHFAVSMPQLGVDQETLIREGALYTKADGPDPEDERGPPTGLFFRDRCNGRVTKIVDGGGGISSGIVWAQAVDENSVPVLTIAALTQHLRICFGRIRPPQDMTGRRINCDFELALNRYGSESPLKLTQGWHAVVTFRTPPGVIPPDPVRTEVYRYSTRWETSDAGNAVLITNLYNTGIAGYEYDMFAIGQDHTDQDTS